jgi:hypothetical protein
MNIGADDDPKTLPISANCFELEKKIILLYYLNLGMSLFIRMMNFVVLT